MARIQGLSEIYLTGDTLLKSDVCEIFSIAASAEGATAGQRVVFRNGDDGNAPPLLVIVLDAANGTLPPMEFSNGKRFENGCYVDFEAAAGHVHLSLTYK